MKRRETLRYEHSEELQWTAHRVDQEDCNTSSVWIQEHRTLCRVWKRLHSGYAALPLLQRRSHPRHHLPALHPHCLRVRPPAALQEG